MGNSIDKKKMIATILCSLALLAVTFVTDRNIFTFPSRDDALYKVAVTDYFVCKILAFLVIYAALSFIRTLIFDKGDKRAGLLEITKCAALYLPVIVIALIIKLPSGYVTNDEYSILENATHLRHDTWFNYMTVYYYIVSLMLVPFRYGPIITKAVIEFFVVGYTVFRTRAHFGKIPGSFMYILFLLYPVIAYTTSAHRLPVYFLLYLALFVKLCFDRIENKTVMVPETFFMLVAGAMLTQWRTEGIYLLALLPILLFIVYPQFRNRKAATLLIVSYLAIQFVISIPQNGTGSGDLSGAANDRMKPFYAYTITNMMRNGLDVEKNATDLAIVDRYIALEAIGAINEHFEDINYEDVLILIKEEFAAVRPEAGYTEYYEFTEAVKRIFINNPDVFLKTRWGAFCYAALPFHITFSGHGAGDLARGAISVVKTISYNLFIPTAVIVLLCVISLFGKDYYTFLVALGLMGHWFIVFILAPASYFKYYFPVYIMAYFYVTFILIRYYDKRTAKRTV